MTDLKHTPGPWVMSPPDGHFGDINISQKGNIHAIAAVLNPLAYDENSKVQTKDNARLIAAAPDLLEAAKEFLEAQHSLVPVDKIAEYHQRVKLAEDNLIDAISKAEGRE
jgi:hypothetical protein